MLAEQPQISVLGGGSSCTRIEQLISVPPVLMKTSLLQIFYKNELMQEARSKECVSEDVLFTSVGNSQSLVSTEVWKPYGKLHKHSENTAVKTT